MPLAEQFLDFKTKLLSSGFFTSSFLQLSLYLMVTLSHINGFLSLENTVILPVACGRSVVQTAQPSLDGFAEFLWQQFYWQLPTGKHHSSEKENVLRLKVGI